MIPYSNIINKNIPGETPKEQYENLMLMKKFLQIVAFPRRGTEEETMNEYELAEMIQGRFNIEDLSEKDIDD